MTKQFLYKVAYQAIQIYWKIFHPITVGVRLMLIADEHVVLVKHVYDGEWHLPGGGMKRRETLEQAVRREAFEEAGAEMQALRLFGVYSSFHQAKSDHVAVFVSNNFHLSQNTDQGEIAEIARFKLDALPETLSQGTQRRLAEYASDAPPRYGMW